MIALVTRVLWLWNFFPWSFSEATPPTCEIRIDPAFSEQIFFNVRPEFVEILQNPDVIKINQDPLGHQARRVVHDKVGEGTWTTRRNLLWGQDVLSLSEEEYRHLRETSYAGVPRGQVGSGGNHVQRNCHTRQGLPEVFTYWTTAVKSNNCRNYQLRVP